MTVDWQPFEQVSDQDVPKAIEQLNSIIARKDPNAPSTTTASTPSAPGTTSAAPSSTHQLSHEQIAKQEEAFKEKETAITKLAALLKRTRQADKLAALIQTARTTLTQIPKSRTTRLVKYLLDQLAEIPDTLPLQVKVCREAIEWATAENRVFLRQALETRLIALYLDTKMYTEAISLIGTLLKELKRLDDKMVLVEVQLLESRVYHALRNLPKSRAALTSARTSATSIYCPPLMQAAIDMQSGILHGEEKDYKTAYSYFYETLEGYSAQENPKAVMALKYMLMCKIMLNQAEDVQSLTSGKVALKYQGRDIEAMKAVASAHKERSLQAFESALSKYKKELTDDTIIRNQTEKLYDTLLEQNLSKLIEPYSCVEISHIAKLIKLDKQQVENKLSKMILDKTLNGVLDQGADQLILFEESTEDQTYAAAIETVKAMDTVTESLFEKAKRLY